MRKQILSLVVLSLAVMVQGYAQFALQVTVKNIKQPKGTIRVGLFDNEKDFLKKAVEGKVVQASGSEVVVIFEELKPGNYGLSVIHDENDNGELDRNFVGMPSEGFAFGNNAMGSFGPPDFDKTLVKIDGTPVKQEITLNHL
ncbi:MAG TPA: DUF2141 domain-containing protein [Ohtaekwangia sp.]|nr:DUF2141 domain-containing protein [Ohtaekwangia sp.]